MISRYLPMAVIAVGAASAVQTQDVRAEPYVGFGYGQYQLEFDTDTDLDDFDDDQDAWRIFGGMQLTDALGAEISLYDFDSAGNTSLSTDLEGASIAALFHAPIIDDRFSLFAKIGWFFWEAEVETTIPGDPVLSSDFDGNDLFFGAGLRIGFSDAFALRLEYDRFELEEDIEPDLDYASASLEFKF